MFEHFLFHIQVDIFNLLVTGVTLHNLFPIRTENRLIDLISRPIKGKLTVSAEHQIFQIVAAILITCIFQDIVDGGCPEHL